FALRANDLDQVFGEAVRALRAIGCDVATVMEQTGAYEFMVRAAAGEGAETAIGKRDSVYQDSKWPAAIKRGATVVSDRAHYESRSADGPGRSGGGAWAAACMCRCRASAARSASSA
ncbi:MAG TPA: hypothetical protein VF110_13930, partial [Burkholderiales bacterium]